MRKYLALITVTLVALGFIGCSKQRQDKALPPAVPPSRVYDLGVVEVSDGVETRHDLGDGRVCIITPSLQKDGDMMLNMRIEESGRIVSKFRAQFDKRTVGFTMRVGDFSISMKPRVEQWHLSDKRQIPLSFQDGINLGWFTRQPVAS